MAVKSKSYVIIWKNETRALKLKWCLRGLTVDGSYYGTVRDMLRHNHFSVSGKLSDDVASKCRMLLTEIAAKQKPLVPGSVVGWRGLFASGSFSKPKIILYYCEDDELVSKKASAFISLTSLLQSAIKWEPYEA